MYLVHHLSDTISVHGREGARHEVDSVIRAVQSLRSAQVCHTRPRGKRDLLLLACLGGAALGIEDEFARVWGQFQCPVT